MARRIDYFFTLVSPWAYIGHALFVDIAARHDTAITYKPVALGTVFPESGGLPLAQRHPLRQHYRSVELQRWREKRGLAFDLKPRFWPFAPTFADCIVVALAANGLAVEHFLPHAFAAIFELSRDLKDPAEIATLLRDGGFDAQALMKAAIEPQTKELYRANTEAALAAGVFGSPAYVLDGEVFWGQDRLDLLQDALASGRAPFKPV